MVENLNDSNETTLSEHNKNSTSNFRHIGFFAPVSTGILIFLFPILLREEFPAVARILFVVIGGIIFISLRLFAYFLLGTMCELSYFIIAYFPFLFWIEFCDLGIVPENIWPFILAVVIVDLIFFFWEKDALKRFIRSIIHPSKNYNDIFIPFIILRNFRAKLIAEYNTQKKILAQNCVLVESSKEINNKVSALSEKYDKKVNALENCFSALNKVPDLFQDYLNTINAQLNSIAHSKDLAYPEELKKHIEDIKETLINNNIREASEIKNIFLSVDRAWHNFLLDNYYGKFFNRTQLAPHEVRILYENGVDIFNDRKISFEHFHKIDNAIFHSGADRERRTFDEERRKRGISNGAHSCSIHKLLEYIAQKKGNCYTDVSIKELKNNKKVDLKYLKDPSTLTFDIVMHAVSK